MAGLRRIPVLLVALAFMAAAPVSRALDFTKVYAFGDSLSDGANGLLANFGTPGLGIALEYYVPTDPRMPPYPSPFNPGGTTKFTNDNGPVAVEIVSLNLAGQTLKPSRLPGGTNYAIGGATTGTANYAYETAVVPTPSPIPGVPAGTHFYPGLANTGIATQVQLFTAGLSGSADAAALYSVWGGPNDVFLALAGGGLPDPAAMAANLSQAVTDLYGAGARQFLVPNMPNLGTIPAFLGNPLAPTLTALTLQFNAQLAGRLATLDATYADISIYPFDTFGLFSAVLANPAAYGFTNTTSPCYVTPGCDPSKFVFWDAAHPTAAAQAVIGAAMTAAVPEPGTYAMLLAGLGLMGFVARRRMLRRTT
jgi:phospholipase/lecithinase/hemolysin